MLGMFTEDNTECAICLSTYEDGEEIRQLACHPRHHFHKVYQTIIIMHHQSNGHVTVNMSIIYICVYTCI